MGNLELPGTVKMLQGERVKVQKKVAKLRNAVGVPHGNRGRQSEGSFDHAKMVLR